VFYMWGTPVFPPVLTCREHVMGSGVSIGTAENVETTLSGVLIVLEQKPKFFTKKLNIFFKKMNIFVNKSHPRLREVL